MRTGDPAKNRAETLAAQVRLVRDLPRSAVEADAYVFLMTGPASNLYPVQLRNAAHALLLIAAAAERRAAALEAATERPGES